MGPEIVVYKRDTGEVIARIPVVLLLGFFLACCFADLVRLAMHR